MTEAQKAHRDFLADAYAQSESITVPGESLQMKQACDRTTTKFFAHGYDTAHAEAQVLVEALEFCRGHLKSMDNYSLVSGAFHEIDCALKAWRREGDE